MQPNKKQRRNETNFRGSLKVSNDWTSLTRDREYSRGHSAARVQNGSGGRDARATIRQALTSQIEKGWEGENTWQETSGLYKITEGIDCSEILGLASLLYLMCEHKLKASVRTSRAQGEAAGLRAEMQAGDEAQGTALSCWEMRGHLGKSPGSLLTWKNGGCAPLAELTLEAECGC